MSKMTVVTIVSNLAYGYRSQEKRVATPKWAATLVVGPIRVVQACRLTAGAD